MPDRIPKNQPSNDNEELDSNKNGRWAQASHPSENAQ